MSLMWVTTSKYGTCWQHSQSQNLNNDRDETSPKFLQTDDSVILMILQPFMGALGVDIVIRCTVSHIIDGMYAFSPEEVASISSPFMTTMVIRQVLVAV